MVASRSLVGLSFLAGVAGYPHFDALHVWPRPRLFTQVGEGRGPVRVDGSTASRTVDGSCGSRVEALLDAAMAPLTTSRVHDTMTNHRTWPRQAYAAVDEVCPMAHRCESDADCTATADASCLVDPTRGRRWNSSHLCNPRSAADALCGCCSDAAVTLRSVAVTTCADATLHRQSPEAYSLHIDSDATDAAAVVTIAAATPQAAAHAISVLSQLIEWDELLQHEHPLPSGVAHAARVRTTHTQSLLVNRGIFLRDRL